jgi:adenine-specific DNA methylase
MKRQTASRPASRLNDWARFRATPAYLGNKRRLCPLIFALIGQYLPRASWPDSHFLDPFCGSCAVSIYAKASGFRVSASDVSELAVVTARGLVANSEVRLDYEDVLSLFDGEAEVQPIAARNVPQIFSADEAEFLDRVLSAAKLKAEPKRSLLLLTIAKLILRLRPMSLLTAADAGAAATGDFDRISPRRLGHYLRARRRLCPEALWAVAREVNAGVFGGRGQASQGDALDFLGSSAGDVVYLDPPYAGTSDYRAYGLLDELLGGGECLTAVPSLDDLLAASHDAGYVVLSYGGATRTLEDLASLVKRHRPVLRALAVPYSHLRSIASEEKNAQNREFVIVAGR